MTPAGPPLLWASVSCRIQGFLRWVLARVRRRCCRRALAMPNLPRNVSDGDGHRRLQGSVPIVNARAQMPSSPYCRTSWSLCPLALTPSSSRARTMASPSIFLSPVATDILLDTPDALILLGCFSISTPSRRSLGGVCELESIPAGYVEAAVVVRERGKAQACLTRATQCTGETQSRQTTSGDSSSWQPTRGPPPSS